MMNHQDGFERLCRRNDELRAELIAASRRTEQLVAESEEFFEKREQLMAHLADVSVSARIEADLGIVTVSPNGQIKIDLNQTAVRHSDTNKLGTRILVALRVAEESRQELLAPSSNETNQKRKI